MAEQAERAGLDDNGPIYLAPDTDEASWRAGHAWWESCGLADARWHAARTGTWVALATQAGSTADEDFPGIAALVDPAGEVVARLPDWHAGTLVVSLPSCLTESGRWAPSDLR